MALVVRPPDGRHVHDRRGAGLVRGGRLPAAVVVQRELRLGALRGQQRIDPAVALQGPFPLTFPIAVYQHDVGCAITGGYVYRGQQVPSARGRYFYADFCTGTFWSFLPVNGKANGLRQEPFSVTNPTTFGEDSHGELYVGTFDGQVYKLSSLRPA